MKVNNKEPIFIAEVKTQNPWGFKSKYSRQRLIETAIQYGSWLSIHTDPRFGGSFDDIYFIRQKTNKPILAKGFHSHNDDIKKALDLGANYVLVVDRIPDFFDVNLDRLLLELSNINNFKSQLDRLDRFKDHYKFFHKELKFVYNGRNLNTGIGKKYIGDYENYREKFKWVCGASLIKTPDDVQRFYPNCDAFIVGENLIDFCKEMYKNKKNE